jgi:hypothetical protein
LQIAHGLIQPLPFHFLDLQLLGCLDLTARTHLSNLLTIIYIIKEKNININKMSSNSILATDTLFYSQLTITLVGIVFTGALIVVQPNNLNVYLPIFSSLLFSWLPSPISTKSINAQIKNVEEKLTLANHKIARNNIYRDEGEGDTLV